MIFDTHAHYDDDAFDSDRDILLGQLRDEGIKRVVNVAAGMESCITSIELAQKYDYFYAAVGVHPSETTNLTDRDLELIEKYCDIEKVVAIGEIGLDYYWPEPGADHQKKFFEAQLEIARRRKLPVIIHSREAAQDTMDIMKRIHAEEIGGVIHCYSYSYEMAREYVDMGFYIGIGGVLTFKNAKKLKECVEKLPIERLVLETDCPYLAPEPNRGKRNSSLNLPYVVQTIADIKGLTKTEVEDITYSNACDLYKLEK